MTQPGSRPRLAITFRHDSPSAMLLHEAAGDAYEIIWVIDSSTAELGALARLIGRLGRVVDVAGLQPAAAARQLAEQQPDAITTFSDDLISQSAELAEALGLAYYTTATAERLVDKAAQRAAFEAAGLPVPARTLISAGASQEQIAAALRVVGYPAVLKPRRGQASRNTFKLAAAEDLPAALRELGGASTPFDMVLEEYLADARQVDPDFADYLSVESVVYGGEVVHLATTGRFPPAPPFRESGFFIPSAVDEPLLTQVLTLAGDAIRALGPERGTFHTEIKLTPAGPRVIEVNGRLGGGVSEMLSSISPVSLFRIAMDLAAGRFEVPDVPVHLTGTGYLFYVHAPAEHGRVAAVHGLEDLRRLPVVNSVVLNRPAGSTVDWRDGNHGYVYAFSGVVDDQDALRRLARSLPTLVQIDIDSGPA